MTNSLFIDSSIFVEYLKNTKTKLLDELLGISDIKLFVSETVVSEFLLYFLVINGRKSAKTLKEANAILQYSKSTLNLT